MQVRWLLLTILVCGAILATDGYLRGQPPQPNPVDRTSIEYRSLGKFVEVIREAGREEFIFRLDGIGGVMLSEPDLGEPLWNVQFYVAGTHYTQRFRDQKSAQLYYNFLVRELTKDGER